jgi:hypothetical protein
MHLCKGRLLCQLQDEYLQIPHSEFQGGVSFKASQETITLVLNKILLTGGSKSVQIKGNASSTERIFLFCPKMPHRLCTAIF